jgi:hypothetical protein
MACAEIEVENYNPLWTIKIKNPCKNRPSRKYSEVHKNYSIF